VGYFPSTRLALAKYFKRYCKNLETKDEEAWVKSKKKKEGVKEITRLKTTGFGKAAVTSPENYGEGLKREETRAGREKLEKGGHSSSSGSY